MYAYWLPLRLVLVLLLLLVAIAAIQVNSSQSARKAASLRAKFEKWESEVERNNEYNHSDKILEEEEEGMPSIDTARNLRAMFENKAQEAARPVANRPKLKVNRFVVSIQTFSRSSCRVLPRTVYIQKED